MELVTEHEYEKNKIIKKFSFDLVEFGEQLNEVNTIIINLN